MPSLSAFLLVSVVCVSPPEKIDSNDTQMKRDSCARIYPHLHSHRFGCMRLTPAEIALQVSSGRLQGSATVIEKDERHALLNYFIYHPSPSTADGAGEKEPQREGDTEEGEKGQQGGAGGKEKPSSSTLPASPTTPTPPSIFTEDIDLEVGCCVFPQGRHGIRVEEPRSRAAVCSILRCLLLLCNVRRCVLCDAFSTLL